MHPEYAGSVWWGPDGPVEVMRSKSQQRTASDLQQGLKNKKPPQKLHKKATYRRSKYFIPVMDKDPSHPPSGDQPAFSQTTTGEYRNITAERSQGRTAAAWEDL